jgi:hypothetical protein
MGGGWVSRAVTQCLRAGSESEARRFQQRHPSLHSAPAAVPTRLSTQGITTGGSTHYHDQAAVAANGGFGLQTKEKPAHRNPVACAARAGPAHRQHHSSAPPV